jgi:ATP-dependent helicase/nuclease subunit A
MKGPRAAGLDGYCKAFFTQEGKILARLATKAALKEMPTLAEVLRAEAERIAAVLDGEGAALGRTHHGAAATRTRHRRALCPRQAPARRARLRRPDRGDTALLESATAPHGCSTSSTAASIMCWSTRPRTPTRPMGSDLAADRGILRRLRRGRPHRTVFAVGDTKQSIFGFQRADPRKLKEMRAIFVDRTRSIQRELRQVHLESRSARPRPCSTPWTGCSPSPMHARPSDADDGEIVHLTAREGQPGRVEVVARGRGAAERYRHDRSRAGAPIPLQPLMNASRT